MCALILFSRTSSTPLQQSDNIQGYHLRQKQKQFARIYILRLPNACKCVIRLIILRILTELAETFPLIDSVIEIAPGACLLPQGHINLSDLAKHTLTVAHTCAASPLFQRQSRVLTPRTPAFVDVVVNQSPKSTDRFCHFSFVSFSAREFSPIGSCVFSLSCRKSHPKSRTFRFVSCFSTCFIHARNDVNAKCVGVYFSFSKKSSRK